MICKCGYNLMKRTKGGVPMLDNRGLLIKGGQAVLICPKCHEDVPTTGGQHQEMVALFFGKPLEPPR